MPLDDTKCDGLGGTQQESEIQHLNSQINAQYSLNLKSAHITTMNMVNVVHNIVFPHQAVMSSSDLTAKGKILHYMPT